MNATEKLQRANEIQAKIARFTLQLQLQNTEMPQVVIRKTHTAQGATKVFVIEDNELMSEYIKNHAIKQLEELEKEFNELMG